VNRHPPLRAAIVGAGLMGRWHAHALTRAGGLLVAVVDPCRPRAEALAAAYPGARHGASLDDVLDWGIDVVHVTTPLPTHAPLALRALDAGCHTLVEKPLAETHAATCALLDAAEARNRLLCPVHQFLFQTGVLRALAALGRVGPLLHVDAVVCSAGADSSSGMDHPALIAEILPHPLALFARLCPGHLADADWQVHYPQPGELRAIARLGPVSVGLLVSSRGRPTSNGLRLVGAHGTVHVDLFHGFCVVEPGEVSRIRKITHPFVLAGATVAAAGLNLVQRTARGEPAYPGLRPLIARYYAAIRGEGAPPIAAPEIAAVAAARDNLLRRALL
jgi:predicted dehydrogenase